MRLFGVLLFVCAALAGWAQAESLGPVDVSVVITEDATTAEQVVVTPRRADYPEKLLREQIARLGSILRVEPRGLYIGVNPLGQAGKFVQARFAVNGLIDRDTNTLRLAPVVRAFAGAPSPYTVNLLQVNFAGERPQPGTISTFKSDAVALVSTINPSPEAIEYTVAILQQDPAKIDIPDKHSPLRRTAEPTPPQAPSMGVVIALIVVASLAAGCLVYFLTLSRGQKPRREGAPRRPLR